MFYFQKIGRTIKSAPLPKEPIYAAYERHRYCSTLIFPDNLITMQLCTLPDADDVHGRSQLVYMHLVRQIASINRYLYLLPQSSQQLNSSFFIACR